MQELSKHCLADGFVKSYLSFNSSMVHLLIMLFDHTVVGEIQEVKIDVQKSVCDSDSHSSSGTPSINASYLLSSALSPKQYLSKKKLCNNNYDDNQKSKHFDVRCKDDPGSKDGHILKRNRDRNQQSIPYTWIWKKYIRCLFFLIYLL